MNQSVQIMIQKLEEAKHEGTFKRYTKHKEPTPFIGVPMGVYNRLAKEYKTSSELWLELWQTKILDAQMLATYLVNPKKVTEEEIKLILNSKDVSLLVWDKFIDKVLSKVENQMDWINYLNKSDEELHHRFRWGLEVRQIVGKVYSENEAAVLLEEIINSLIEAPEDVKWVMNRCLVEIAVNYPTLYNKAYQASADMGVYRDMKVAKGCTSAYAPEWIDALMRNRKKI